MLELRRRHLLPLLLSLAFPLAAQTPESEPVPGTPPAGTGAAQQARPPAATSGAPLASEEDKTLYALGLALARNLAPFGLSEAELGKVAQGLRDGVLGREPRVDLNAYGTKIQELAASRRGPAVQAEREAGAALLEQAAAEEGAVRLTSGIVVRMLAPGTGASPQVSDKVRVTYEGKLRDGTVFDSSKGQPVDFVLAQVIPCWQQGLQQMQVGGKAKIVCPPDVAYGDAGAPPSIPGGATLVVEVELLAVNP